MELEQVWGALLIFVCCPLLGGLPLIAWMTQLLTGKQLRRLGTGNVGVSAAFYHGGRWIGGLAVLSEASKGIAAVLLARSFFPNNPEWEMISLMALVVGRYWISQGAGTTNVVWGYVVHDPIAALLVFLIGGIGFTLFRERHQGRISILVLFPLITLFRHPQQPALMVTAISLSVLLYRIYQKIPDDLDLPTPSVKAESRAMFQFFRSDRAIVTLDQLLAVDKVGAKAATLAQLKRWGYPVPPGWVLPPGDDPEPLLTLLHPSSQEPLVVRSSVIGEDSELASAAGQYETVLSVTNQTDLRSAIVRCLASYDHPGAWQYRRDRGLPDAAMAVLIQQQVQGVVSGVAFSRDPIARQGDAVVIEALPGAATQVVSGRITPIRYQVQITEAEFKAVNLADAASWQLPDCLDLALSTPSSDAPAAKKIPLGLIQQVAFLARHLESRYHGIPQDIEWSYDGQILWLLQSRPITTLLPIWTRKIAAEVIPGVIRPLTWSINRPLTCRAWGDLFTLVLGDRAQGLDFTATATLHYSRAYFNASLLGQIFLRMGLPPESLEFLTRGRQFSQPPLRSTLRNVPGLLKLLGRELRLEIAFRRDDRQLFAPAIAQFAQVPADQLAPAELLTRIDTILAILQRATDYSILAPLSAALRKSIFRVADTELDNRQTPEVSALRSLQQIARSFSDWGIVATDANDAIDETAPANSQNPPAKIVSASDLFEKLANSSVGQTLLTQFDQWLDHYGYLSEVGTDIAVPTWKEDPTPVRELFAQFCLNPPSQAAPHHQVSGKVRRVQRRFDLKGQVTEVYSRLLAELRWSCVALEQRWLQVGVLSAPGDIFFLELNEVRDLVQGSDLSTLNGASQRIAQRRSQYQQDSQIATISSLVYGDDPPLPDQSFSPRSSTQQLQGIGASSGRIEGRVKVLRDLQASSGLDREIILVVPYTDSGWAPLLARAGGLIAEVGGQLSHGAIVAREYRIPAVMDVHNATQQLHDGQWVRIDGTTGIVEIL
ncbi:MAG: glycerol-3-phosphate acyltransferase [Scytolyngbya sp. HA4215-MV1]|jgi:pyruvate,water dikinase|nr:glycerol-3-phosphate acyltransferase [Scytolyngbya sp. HA4215-MV1]